VFYAKHDPKQYSLAILGTHPKNNNQKQQTAYTVLNLMANKIPGSAWIHITKHL
jgi:hypothetical protein